MRLSQSTKVLNRLYANRRSPGQTVAQIAHATRVSKDNVYRRIYDLRQEGFNVYTNVRNVNGKRKSYYRLAI